METAWDKSRALLLSLLLHGLLVLGLFLGLLWKSLPQASAAAGPPIQATVVSAPRAAELAREIRAFEHPAEQVAAQPRHEPRPQDSPVPPQPLPQMRIPKPDTVDQAEVRRAAALAAEQQQRHEQEERHKQAQIDLDRQQEQEREEVRQRLAAIQQQRADAERQIKLHEQALAQLHDQQTQLALNKRPARAAPTEPPRPLAGNNGRQNGLLSQYLRGIQQVANDNWIHDDDVPQRVHCIVSFKQRVGGEVIEVTFVDCPFDEVGRESVNRALLRTTLPYAGYESVWQREGTIDFCYPVEECAR